MPTIKEIKTLFTLDKQQMDKELKNIDRQVQKFTDDFEKANKEITETEKALKAISSDLKKMNAGNSDAKKMAKDFSDVSNQIAKARKEMTQLKREMSSANGGLKGIGNISTSDITKLANVMKSMNNIEIVKQNALKGALSDAKRLRSELESISNIRVNVNSTNRLGTSNDNLRHWMNTGNGGASDADDTVRLLRELVNKLGNEAQRKAGQSIPEIDKVISAINKGADKICNAIEKTKKAAQQADKYDNRNSRIRENFVSSLTDKEKDAIGMMRNSDKDGGFDVDFGDLNANEISAVQSKLANAIKSINKLDKLPGVFQRIGSAFNKAFNLGDSKAGKFFADIGGRAAGAGEELGALGAQSGKAAGGLSKLGAAGGIAAGAIVVLVAAFVAYVAIVKKLVDVMNIAIQKSSEFQTAVAKFAVKTGAAQEGIKAFGDELKNVFRNQGYTEDINEMAGALTLVHQALGLNGKAAEDMSKNLMMMSKVTELDVKEIVRAQKNLMANTQLNAEEALDMILATYQQTGDLTGDMLDTFTEYSSQLNRAGLSAEWFYSLLVTGSKSGVMNLDKLADQMKEFQNIFAKGDDSVIKSFNDLGISYSKLREDFKKGGADAEHAMARVYGAIGQIQDKVQRQNIIAAIFGSPGEDLGTKFYEEMAKATGAVDNFRGSVEEANKAMEQTLGYQITELKNTFTEIWDVVGEKLVPIVSTAVENIKTHMDDIRKAVDEHLAPAFVKLATLIMWAFGVEDPTNFAELIVKVIEFLGGLIDAIVKVGIAFIYLGKVLRTIWNVVELLVKFFLLGLSTIGMAVTELAVLIVNGIVQLGAIIVGTITGLCKTIWELILALGKIIVDIFIAIGVGIGGAVEGIVRSFDDAFMLILKGAGNLGIGLVNVIVGAAKEVANAFIKWAVGPIIDAYNNTLGLIPGIPKIKKPGTFDTSKPTLNYISMDKELDGLKKAWTTDNKIFNSAKFLNPGENFKNIAKAWTDNQAFKSMGKIQKDFNKFYKTIYDWFDDNFNQGLVKSIDQDLKDLSNTWANGAGSYDDLLKKMQAKIEDLRKNGKITKEEADKAVDKIKKELANTDGKYNGKDPLTGEKEKDAEDKLKKIQDYWKRYLAFQKEAQKRLIDINTKIAEQKWDMKQQSMELLQEQFDFYKGIMKNYKLTAEENIAYTEKMRDIAKEMLSQVVADHKKALQKQENDLKESNNKKIKEQEAYIRQLEHQLKDLEESWQDEDSNAAIAKVEKELQKYLYATSYEGIKKRQELEEELARLQKEKERTEQRRDIEDKKEVAQEEIDNLNTKNQEIEDSYSTLYDELETLVNDKEAFLAKLRETIAKTGNDAIRADLLQLETDYLNAYKNIEATALNMKDVMNWYITDDKRQWAEGSLTGDKDAQQEAAWDAADARANGGTIQSGDSLPANQYWGVNPDYLKIQELGKEWARLNTLKNGSNDADIKKQQDALHAQANKIRAKYGLKYPENPPMYLQPTFHNGGIVDGIRNKLGEVVSRLLPGEVVFNHRQVLGLLDFFESFKMSSGLNPAVANAVGYTNGMVVNGPLVNIENFNNNSGADIRQISQEMNVRTQLKNNARGQRFLP